MLTRSNLDKQLMLAVSLVRVKILVFSYLSLFGQVACWGDLTILKLLYSRDSKYKWFGVLKCTMRVFVSFLL